MRSQTFSHRRAEESYVPQQPPALHEKGKKRATLFVEPFGPIIGIFK